MDNNDSIHSDEITYDKELYLNMLCGRYLNEFAKTKEIVQEDPDAELFVSGIVLITHRTDLDNNDCIYTTCHSSFGDIDDLIKALETVIIKKLKQIKEPNAFQEYLEYFIKIAIDEGVLPKPDSGV